jgi:hypothetical protein
MSKRIFLISLLVFGKMAFGLQTQYYTMVGETVNRYECGMEGNQIVNGQLVGSNCKPYTEKYCPWGVGNKSNCIVPCVHAAGPYRTNSVRAITPFTCPWGPLKGQTIRSVIIADVGPQHVDVFVGLCIKKKMVRNRRGQWVRTNVCSEYASPTMMASYGAGRGRETQIAANLMNQHHPGLGTAFYNSGGNIQTAALAVGQGQMPARPVPAPAPRPVTVAPSAPVVQVPQMPRPPAPARPVQTATLDFSSGFIR